MSDILRAMAISAGILLPVVVLIVIVSIAAVRRGEAAMLGDAHGISAAHPAFVPATATVTAAPKAAKPASAAAGDEISVVAILILGVGLFTLTVALLMGVSILGHL